MSVDWSALRGEFPALEEWTYLNTATFGQLPRRGMEAVSRHFERRTRIACTDFLEWFGEMDRVREMVARLVHCASGDVAFIPNASTALSLLLGGMDWKPGDRIVTLEHEFPNHYYHPSWLRHRGVTFVETGYENLREAVNHRTRLVALSEVNYSTGFRAPIEEIARFVKGNGALLYVDGTQSVGAFEFDVSRVQPDLLAVHGYKWLLSPNGAGFMYVSPSLRERLDPSVIGWRSDRRWRDFENLHHGMPEFSGEGEKYEGGMLAFAVLYAMAEAIGMMLEIGPAVIERRVMELADATRAILREAGAEVLSDADPQYRSAIVTARFEGVDVSKLARELAARKILVSARQRNLRVSPHFYNNEADLRRLAEALAELGIRGRASVRIPPESSCPAG